MTTRKRTVTRVLSIIVGLAVSATLCAEQKWSAKMTDRWLPGADAVWLAAPEVDVQRAYTALTGPTDLTSPPAVSRKAVWLLYNIETNDQDHPQRYVLTNENVTLAKLNVFAFNAAGNLLQSLSLGMSQPDLADKAAVRRHQGTLALQPNQNYHLLLRLHSDTPLGVAIRVSPEDRLEALNQTRYARDWAMLVIVIAMFLFNAALFFGHGDRAYRWFMVFHLVIGLYFAGLTGFGHLVLPVGLMQFLAGKILAMNFVLLFLLYAFTLSFLSREIPLPAAEKPWFRWGLPSLHGLGFLLSLTLPDYYLLSAFTLIQVLTVIPMLAFAWHLARAGYDPAYFLLASILVQVVGGAVGTAAFTGLIPANEISLNAFFASTVVELLLMSFAVSSRIRFLETRQRNVLLQDTATHLPNRAYFNRVLEPNWSLEKIRLGNPAVAVIKLTGFKHIIQLMGPSMALRVWVEVVGQWNDFLRQKSWVHPMPHFQGAAALALWEEDSFLALIDRSRVDTLAQDFAGMRLVQSKLDDHPFEIEATIAVYDVPSENVPLDELMRKLDVAMVTAKRTRHFVQRFTEQQDADFQRQNQLTRAFRTTLDKQLLEPYVQPVLDLASGHIVGGEILMRWTDPVFGPISPGEFIPLAEKMNWVSQMTQQVLTKTAAWLIAEADLSRVQLSINLSVLDLVTEVDGLDLPSRVLASRLPPHRLKVEVTESVLMEKPDQCLVTLDQLRALGCQISIDDFGTGYSSLAYLSRIRPDEIKIDRAFISTMNDSIIDRNIVAAIVRLARDMDACVVAEGVEDSNTLAACRNLGCDRIQGYLIARPMPLNEFRQWLAEAEIQKTGLIGHTF